MPFSYQVRECAGIDETSVAPAGDPPVGGNDSPSFASFSTFFTDNYAMTLELAFSVCDGKSDGECDSRNIYNYYRHFQTHYDSFGSPPYPLVEAETDISYYAVGLCRQTISGYSDWFLPAICEMGYDNPDLPQDSGCGDSSTPATQNMLSNLVNHGNIGGLLPNSGENDYWTSTEDSFSPDTFAWSQAYDGSLNLQLRNPKNVGTAVRCARKFGYPPP